MRTTFAFALCSLAPLAGCGLFDGNGLTIDYALPTQEFKQDFGATTGTLPDVACTMPAQCSALPKVAGATATCDGGKCVLQADLRVTQMVDISKSVPQQVASAKAITSVQVTAVNYWVPENSLSFDTPDIDLYVGPASIMKETDAGAVKMGTVPSLPKGGTVPPASPRQLPLTAAGQGALATVAQNYKTPFNVLAVGHVTIRAGQPVPSGKIDLLVQVKVGYKISL